MFENAQWIALAHADTDVPWKNKPYENEEVETWHGDPAYAHMENGSVVFRKTFTLASAPEKATLSICGLGFYEVWINGVKPDEKRVLAPLVSDYFRYTRYNVYDIAPLLQKGENLIAVEVCGGWFTGKERFWGWQQAYYGNPRLIAQIEGATADGTPFFIGTERDTWKVTHGTVTHSCIYDGEKADLNLLPKNWMTNGYDDADWQVPQPAVAPTDVLIPDESPAVRIVKEIAPVDSWTVSGGTVYDFGENGTAVARIAAAGKKGDTVTLHFAEYLDADGDLNELSCTGGGSLNTDIFTLTGDECDTVQARFTWHGFRYCRLTVSSPDVRVISVAKLELHSDIAATGDFTCSNESLNRLHRAYAQTQIGCLVGAPVDCPQRGERKGWIGDAGVSCEEAIYNFDMQALYASFLADMRRERHEGRRTFGIICPDHKSSYEGTCIDWAIAYPIMITESYARYGDKTILSDNLEALETYTAFYNGLREADGLLPSRYFDKYKGKTIAPAWFGDWYTVDYPDGTERVAFDCGDENHRQNPCYLGSIFYAWVLHLTAQVEEALGNADKAEQYETMRRETLRGLYEKYYHKDTHTLGAGGQFLQTIALYTGVVPPEEREAAFGALLASFEEVGWHAKFGIFGQRLIGEVMRSFGREDLLYRLMTQPGYPGFMHMIENGQTTVAENLTGGDNDVWGSGCHCMFAAADANLHRIFGGITVNRFEKVPLLLAPYAPADLNAASDVQKLPEGEVRVAWKRQGEAITFRFTVPQGMTAVIKLAQNGAAFDETVGGGQFTVIFRDGRFTVQ